MSDLRDRFVSLLKSQVGYHEGHDSSGWNNMQKYSPATPGLEWSQGQAWCATFQAWGAHYLGMDAMWPMTASCSTAVQWWQDHGRWSEYPVLGGPLYMGPSGGDHTEVVWKYTADRVCSVGGNTNDSGSYQGDGVYLHDRPRRGAGSPYGYGVPAYPNTISADPDRGGIAAAETKTVPVEDTVALTPAEITAVANAVWAKQMTSPVSGGKFSAEVFLSYGDEHLGRTLDAVSALSAKVDAIEATAMTPAQIAALAAAVADILSARLKD